jgi:hypothetical protein
VVTDIQARLFQALIYDPGTGEFRRRKTGRLIDTRDRQGYRVIYFDGKLRRAARLAWLYMTGAWPDNFVDHVDTDPANDRWNNLRTATPAQNMHNRRKRANSSTGLKGAFYSKRDKRYLSSIGVNGRQIYLGYFGTAEEAALAYAKASAELHGEYGRVSNPHSPASVPGARP